MIRRPKRPRACSYLVNLESALEERETQAFAAYLSTLGAAGCDVIVLDSAPRFEDRHHILRWVAQHVAVAEAADLLERASEMAGTEKIIVAGADSRYTAEEIGTMCELLDRHDAVEPEEYVQPLPWWGGIDAGRLLLSRGIEQPARRSTFAVRRAAFRSIPGIDTRDLIDAYEAKEVFVRRQPPAFAHWLRARLQEPVRPNVFLALLPMMLLMALVGGAQVAAGYGALIAFASLLVAIRGRVGAGRFFPLHACLFAPVWIAERSITGYWFVIQRMRRTSAQEVADALPVTPLVARRKDA